MFLQSFVGLLKIITFGLPLNENGALSAIPTEGNGVERPKATLSPFSSERKCVERLEGALREP